MWEVSFVDESVGLLIGDFDINHKPVEGLVIDGMRIDFIYWMDEESMTAEVGFSYV